jgi:hypothetical protein
MQIEQSARSEAGAVAETVKDETMPRRRAKKPLTLKEDVQWARQNMS